MFDKQAAVTTQQLDPVAPLDMSVATSNRALIEALGHLANVDADELWLHYGIASITDLLASRYGLSRATARDWQRVGDCLPSLPRIRETFERGRLSWEQLREVTKIATPPTDDEWAVWAQEMTPAEIRNARKPPTAPAVDEAHNQRSLHWWFDAHAPQFHLKMTCPDTEGAVIATALQRLVTKAQSDPHSGVYESFESQSADALWQMASQTLSADSDADRATVVISAKLGTILGHVEEPAHILDGPAILPATLHRLLCDARLQLAVEGAADSVVGVGRTMRTPPPALRRIVLTRDNGCRFPRCRRNRWVHVHHLVHWANGGPTDLDNLITLCGFHHRLIHEGGWTVSGDPNIEVTWIDRSGWVHDPGPPTEEMEIHRREMDTRSDVTPPVRLTRHGLPPP